MQITIIMHIMVQRPRLCSMSGGTVPGPERPIVHPSTPAGVSKVHSSANIPSDQIPAAIQSWVACS